MIRISIICGIFGLIRIEYTYIYKKKYCLLFPALLHVHTVALMPSARSSSTPQAGSASADASSAPTEPAERFSPPPTRVARFSRRFQRQPVSQRNVRENKSETHAHARADFPCACARCTRRAESELWARQPRVERCMACVCRVSTRALREVIDGMIRLLLHAGTSPMATHWYTRVRSRFDRPHIMRTRA